MPIDNEPLENTIEINTNSMFPTPVDEKEVLDTIKNVTTNDVNDIDMSSQECNRSNSQTIYTYLQFVISMWAISFQT